MATTKNSHSQSTKIFILLFGMATIVAITLTLFFLFHKFGFFSTPRVSFAALGACLVFSCWLGMTMVARLKIHSRRLSFGVAIILSVLIGILLALAIGINIFLTDHPEIAFSIQWESSAVASGVPWNEIHSTFYLDAILPCTYIVLVCCWIISLCVIDRAKDPFSEKSDRWLVPYSLKHRAKIGRQMDGDDFLTVDALLHAEIAISRNNSCEIILFMDSIPDGYHYAKLSLRHGGSWLSSLFSEVQIQMIPLTFLQLDGLIEKFGPKKKCWIYYKRKFSRSKKCWAANTLPNV